MIGILALGVAAPCARLRRALYAMVSIGGDSPAPCGNSALLRALPASDRHVGKVRKD